MKEIWKQIVGYEGYFEVSNFGRIKGVDRQITNNNLKVIFVKEKILTPAESNKGYFRVCLSVENKTKTLSVHRLVAEAFVLGDNSLQVNHIDGDKKNNYYTNLEWVTNQQNCIHASILGLRASTKGISNGNFNGAVNFYKDGEFMGSLYGSADMKNKGFTPSCVSRCVNGILNTHKGFMFKKQTALYLEKN